MRIMPERRPAATDAAPAAGTGVTRRPGGPTVRMDGGDAAPAGGAS
ncbi:hypothetical protein [Streptosporangium sandarakinum]